MSHITLKVTYKEAKQAVKREFPNVMDKVTGLYHRINDYFDIQEGTSDVAWFWGFLAFSGSSCCLILAICAVTAGL
ncbi:hypothetical protein MOD91_18240 [Bacillus haynesii]|uniref:hypothetical protein n=1 Tax=Bacillus haynesii TaxID=1925021 RepID=UPI00227F894B|nr:hypothetical protein [Bacillus haynesii]MCY8048463.1 hypothetical protein [Bacillus haynesii]MCY8668801.1 hypothetical protein [Bacillus haynesii]MCY9324060.1 hypothetical protein [Bacillus haynesii]